MNWKNDKWRLIVFLILIISGMLKMLGSEHSDSGMIKLKESIQYYKNSIVEVIMIDKDAAKGKANVSALEIKIIKILMN